MMDYLSIVVIVNIFLMIILSPLAIPLSMFIYAFNTFEQLKRKG